MGNPETRLCYEEEDVADLPFNVRIDDDIESPTCPQIFGACLARNLKISHLLDAETADQLQHGWNVRPM